jgi:hypothetical protein
MAKPATYEPMTLANMRANGVTRLDRRHVARCRARGSLFEPDNDSLEWNLGRHRTGVTLALRVFQKHR